jgi:hypothetical protein
MTIWRLLHEVLFSYYLQRMQGLMPADFPAQEKFCRCFVQRSAEHFFASSVLFTNEARFDRDSIINIYKLHQWAEENPYGLIHSRLQQQFSINMCSGFGGDCLVGPHILKLRLTGNHYRDFLLHDIPKLLEYVPLAVRPGTWYVRNGAPVYFNCDVQDVLSNTYYYRWIGNEGPTARFPFSLDLNPLKFFLRRHLISMIYAALLDNKEALQHRIENACQTIRNYPGVFERMRRSMMRRVEACTKSHGRHFQHIF